MNRRAVLVSLLVLLMLGHCGGERTTWLMRYPKPLARQTEGVEGCPCDEGSPKACDPFVCYRDACRVETCTNDGECKRGSCIEGYCALPPPQPGRRCEAFDVDEFRREFEPGNPRLASQSPEHGSAEARWLARFDGCACRPEYWTEGSTSAHAPECGSFPCTPNGCYVRECSSDSDCAFGLCSSHASWPHGWCVESDPH